jgi:hypothetical protein
MARAINSDELLITCKVRNLKHLATIGNVSQPRISQILSLTMLAPGIQETLLFLPRLSEGRPEISEKSRCKITMLDDWYEQRGPWRNATALHSRNFYSAQLFQTLPRLD